MWQTPGSDQQVLGRPQRFVSDPPNKRIKKGKRGVNFTAVQMSYLVSHFNCLKKNPDRKKRRVILSDSESDSETNNHFLAIPKKKGKKCSDNEDSTSESDYLPSTHSSYMIGRSKKKQKTTHNGCELVVQLKNRKGEIVPVRALCDTGTTSTIILRDFAYEINVEKQHATTWRTMGGNFTTRKKALIKFKLPEFSTTKTITWNAPSTSRPTKN